MLTGPGPAPGRAAVRGSRPARPAGRKARMPLPRRTEVEIAPVPQRFPDVADRVARFDGIDRRELAARRVVDGDDDGLADRRRRPLQEGPALAPDVEMLGHRSPIRARSAPTRKRPVSSAWASRPSAAISWSTRWAALRGMSVARARSRTPHSPESANASRTRTQRAIGPLGEGQPEAATAAQTPSTAASPVGKVRGRLTVSGCAWHSEHSSGMGPPSR